MNFDQKLKMLETMIQGLEKNQLGLEEGLVEYEKAIALYKECQDFLKTMEAKVHVLTDSLEIQEDLNDSSLNKK